MGGALAAALVERGRPLLYRAVVGPAGQGALQQVRVGGWGILHTRMRDQRLHRLTGHMLTLMHVLLVQLAGNINNTHPGHLRSGWRPARLALVEVARAGAGAAGAAGGARLGWGAVRREAGRVAVVLRGHPLGYAAARRIRHARRVVACMARQLFP